MLDTLPCLTWLFCDKWLTFARGSEGICENMNRGTLMVQGGENSVMRPCTDMFYFGTINIEFSNTKYY